MDAVLTPEQIALARAARDVASDGLGDARVMLDGGLPPERITTALFEGFNGLGIDEDRGGAGGTLVDVALVARELGRTVCPTAWLPHQLALQAAAAGGLDITEGMRPQARWVVLDGDPTAVRHGAQAEFAVVIDDDEVELRPVGEVTIRRAMDPSRPMAEVGLGPWIARSDRGGIQALLRARAVIAAGLAGTGLGAIERAAAYARERQQFGKPVGIFQGVAHQLAEAWTQVELSWSLALYACWAVAEGQPEAAQAVDAAVAKTGNAAVFAAERGMQVHGGIGITWEADPHLALRRAMSDDAWLGSARQAELSLGKAVLGA
ncbi:MAG: acyl-CoA dehydrogenase family protein [Euzebya sp.]